MYNDGACECVTIHPGGLHSLAYSVQYVVTYPRVGSYYEAQQQQQIKFWPYVRSTYSHLTPGLFASFVDLIFTEAMHDRE